MSGVACGVISDCFLGYLDLPYYMYCFCGTATTLVMELAAQRCALEMEESSPVWQMHAASGPQRHRNIANQPWIIRNFTPQCRVAL